MDAENGALEFSGRNEAGHISFFHQHSQHTTFHVVASTPQAPLLRLTGSSELEAEALHRHTSQTHLLFPVVFPIAIRPLRCTISPPMRGSIRLHANHSPSRSLRTTPFGLLGNNLDSQNSARTGMVIPAIGQVRTTSVT